MITNRAEMIRLRDERKQQRTRGVNITQLSMEQMRRIKEGLGDLFQLGIDPLLAKWLREAGDWEGWQAFEGAYKESMHRLRMQITKAIGRDPRR
jgi:hypothetical protein